MGISLRPTADYTAAKADLNLSARLALRIVEQGIKADPDHRIGRIDYTSPMLRGATVVAEQNGDLIVIFHRISAMIVSLDLVIDLKNPPDWYLVE